MIEILWLMSLVRTECRTFYVTDHPWAGGRKYIECVRRVQVPIPIRTVPTYIHDGQWGAWAVTVPPKSCQGKTRYVVSTDGPRAADSQCQGEQWVRLQ